MHLRSVLISDLCTFLRRQCCLRLAPPINSVYFPITAVISLVIGLETGGMTKSAMVGRDGAVGIASVLDGKIALSRGIVQLVAMRLFAIRVHSKA